MVSFPATSGGDAPKYSFYITTCDNDNEWLPVATLEFKLMDPAVVMRVHGVTGERVE